MVDVSSGFSEVCECFVEEVGVVAVYDLCGYGFGAGADDGVVGVGEGLVFSLDDLCGGEVFVDLLFDVATFGVVIVVVGCVHVVSQMIIGYACALLLQCLAYLLIDMLVYMVFYLRQTRR